jgi:hypothetical protein
MELRETVYMLQARPEMVQVELFVEVSIVLEVSSLVRNQVYLV